VVDRARLEAVRPDHEGQHDHPLHRLLARLDLAEVAPSGREHRDIDTWADLRDLAE
jgi:CTP:molybdopterin cytidylyltransferase MocA